MMTFSARLMAACTASSLRKLYIYVYVYIYREREDRESVQVQSGMSSDLLASLYIDTDKETDS